MLYKCSGPRFGQIDNPYTGKTMQVMMRVSRTGDIRMFAPDTYSTADFFPSAKEAYRAWNRVTGVEGLKDGEPPTCAYTGKPLRLVQTEDGWHYEGGFDPHLLRPRDEFLYFAAMRGGKSPYAPGTPGRVTAPPREGRVTDAMRKHAEGQRMELHDDSVKHAEETLASRPDLFHLESNTVSMAGADKGKGGPDRGKGGSGKGGAGRSGGRR